jgi:predicted aspartyl protease
VPDVPLVITPDGEHPDLATVSVDGSVAGRPHRFVLDTGAARSQLVADDLLASYATVGRHATSGVFGRAEQDVVRVPDLTVGTLRHGPLDVVLVAPGAEVRDLLGMDVLGQHPWRFDFAGRTLEPDPPTPGSTLPLHLDDRGHPYVEVVLDGVTAQAVWDTGAEVTVVDARFAEGHRRLFHGDRPSCGTDATGAQREADLMTMAGCVVGGVHLAPSTVAVVDLSALNATLDLPMDLVAGWPLLCQTRWWFDFPGRRWAAGA